MSSPNAAYPDIPEADPVKPRRHEWPLWEIFIRGQHGLSHRHVGIAARARRRDGDQERPRRLYPPQRGRVSIWVVEARHIAASSPDEKGPLYEPSKSKVYRHPTFFDIPDDVGAM